MAGVKAGEGLALWLSSDESRNSSVYAHPVITGEAHNEPTKTLRFSSPRPTSLGSSINEGNSTNKSFIRHVTLPVANTIFVNGQRTTLFEDSWEVKLSSTEKADINYLHRKTLDSFRINLSCSADEVAAGGSAPLQALTEPRLVLGSMGNVLSQIEVNGEAIPASQELEKAVSAYIKSNPTSTDQGPLLVYALVRTSLQPYTNSSSTEKSSIRPSRVLEALWQGAKLFKVSGGGGGWGKRQGLLSLEPAVDFETRESDFPAGVASLDDDQNIVTQLGSNGILPESCTVQFLVYSPDQAAKDDSLGSSSDDVVMRTPTDLATVVLGTATDPEAQDHLMEASDADETGVSFLRAHFGMISYGGAALGSIDSVSQSTVTRTRLDVPNSTFILRNVRGHKAEETSRELATSMRWRLPTLDEFQEELSSLSNIESGDKTPIRLHDKSQP